MSEMRLIQNFANFHATIVSGADVSGLITILARFGVRSTLMTGASGTVLPILPLLRREQDLLIVDSDTDAAKELAVATSPYLAAVPVIGLLGGEAPSRLKAMMRLGATALIRFPVHGATIYPALFLGINAHRRRQHDDTVIDDLERRRRGRRYISKAILHRMHVQGVSDDDAYEALRREAMQARQSIEDYCESCVGEAKSYVFEAAVMVA